MYNTTEVPTKVTRKRRFGFTLVELLVVIGIIALLISILLPALSAARRQAASIKCLSNLRQLAYAFQMYAGNNKNLFPLARQDYPEVAGVPQNTQNWYWTDALYPFVLKNPTPTSSFTVRDALNYRKSTLWCPTWEAEHEEIRPEVNYADRFKNGYGYNLYPSFKPDYPKPDGMVPSPQIVVRSTALFATAPYGRYYKKNEYSDAANRMLVADSNLWCIGLGITNANGDLKGQYVNSAVNLAHGDTPGGTNYDYYRHGKYPKNDGARFDVRGGKVAFNVMFVDGHAATLVDRAAGYKAIRMRYP
jgi:prepilin-type N-terminal cleavage/methylation domain-containing protein/prepilin-type processing-associated H-X9-DG protein